MTLNNSFLNEYDGTALSPILFLKRAILSNGDDVAIIDGEYRWTWRQYAYRCERIAVSLQQMGVNKGNVVSALLPNTHELLELHFAVPLAGGILNALSTRIDSATLNFILEKLSPNIFIIDMSYISLLDNVYFNNPIKIIFVDGNNLNTPISIAENLFYPYESLITEHTSKPLSFVPFDEQDAISINSTSGTSGQPKLVVYSHRGAFLNAVSNILDWDMPKRPTYLWTLPMFHCNGWCFPWTIAARAGTHVCISKFDAEKATFLIQEHNVTHYCGAPIVHYSIGRTAQKYGIHFNGRVSGLIAGAPPTEMMFSLLDTAGITATHVYGLTETYGPVVVCENKPEWEDLPKSEMILKKMRQGIVSNLQGQVSVIDENSETEVPFDGKTIGEVAVRGNIVASYDPVRYVSLETTSQWFYTGDLAVVEPDGYIKIIDRKKDIIISGGENISSLELENALSSYPGITAVAVVAKPDDYWGEVPHAFIELDENASLTEQELDDYICTIVARYKRPKGYTFLLLPRNANGKIMKDQLRSRVKN
ncbi:putative chain-fatty-acid-CoA ligase FadD13 [Xenorhabdus mauleonii]|uniref:Chain-fatty-acid-CoA ligase FadD13 n=1 Tax=Xenorhabdus mauleonii TaxID=351675 RepID=A0A1I3S0C6_9GAMM|nr:AMP-binding protein [Xenorhabdus mauleonii]PHM46357.1 putative chain-fatty-acid-CoA ligase FadD13 [Xenorhabdus mauleonii]SFJ51780.1 fatty-acyl-CoA synthase [Xenorhabdus mauleonii]